MLVVAGCFAAESRFWPPNKEEADVPLVGAAAPPAGRLNIEDTGALEAGLALLAGVLDINKDGAAASDVLGGWDAAVA